MVLELFGGDLAVDPYAAVGALFACRLAVKEVQDGAAAGTRQEQRTQQRQQRQSAHDHPPRRRSGPGLDGHAAISTGGTRTQDQLLNRQGSRRSEADPPLLGALAGLLQRTGGVRGLRRLLDAVEAAGCGG